MGEFQPDTPQVKSSEDGCVGCMGCDMMWAMDGDWLRLGGVIRAARKRKGLSQVRLGDEIGVKRTVIQTIERGHEFQSVTATLRDIERVLEWGQGSIENVLEGGDPLPPETPGARYYAKHFRHESGGDLPVRVSRALAEGTTLDTAIVPLSPNAELVVVVKGKPAATHDQIMTALQTWERKEGYLERLGDTGEGPDA
jgi:transcriptional regulator with XRE-family HTH domain